MTPEKLVEELEKVCPEGLVSIVLYGSAVAGDHIGKPSDYNVLVVTKDLGIATLDALSKPAQAWAKAGNPAPLLFTKERLSQSTDVFPIELLDIYECHTILYGDNVVKDLKIDTKNLRLQIEHELRGNLIKLRQSYLLTQGKSKAVVELMTQSLSTFLVLFRAALRLFESNVPQMKVDALDQLAGHLDFDADVFKIVQDLKEGLIKAKDISSSDVFSLYLKTIECVVDAVDASAE